MGTGLFFFCDEREDLPAGVLSWEVLVASREVVARFRMVVGWEFGLEILNN